MLPAPGRTVRLSLAQRFLDDLTRCARGVPVMTLGRRMRLTAAAEARRRAGGRPGWCALFTKAFALVAARRPGLRRAYLPCPRPRLYEHPFSVAAVAVPRAAGGAEALLFARVRAPEKQSLRVLDRLLRRYEEGPLESVATFRRALAAGGRRPPWRRLRWWWDARCSGPRRARRLGTFAVVPGLDPAGPHALTPLTCTLHFGPVSPGGAADVSLAFDQRVLGGGSVAATLEEMERVMQEEIVEELQAPGPDQHAPTIR